MKYRFLRLFTCFMATLLTLSALTACRSEDGTEDPASDSALDSTRVTLAGAVTDTGCTDGAAHTYNEAAPCEDTTCTVCGHVLHREHAWVLSEESTATLLHGGTVIRTCTTCKQEETTETEEPLSPELLNMPVVYLDDATGATVPLTELEKADGEIAVACRYVSNDERIASFEGYSRIKIQGATSATFPKKNFTVKLFEDEALTKKSKVDFGWGKENQYCLKANYIDFSQARNIVAARLFAEVVASRDDIPQGLSQAPSYGVIDGYPVLVYINNEFHGLYTLNIPKDHWQFAMEGGEEAREALLMANGWTQAVTLHELIGRVSSGTGSTWEDYGFKVEHCSTANDSWIRTSFNQMINTLNGTNKKAVVSQLPKYLDIDAAIDNMIFTYFLNAADNVAKNILWATYDGEVWIPSMYDMDGTFGLYWNGQPVGTTRADGLPENASHTYPSIGNGTLHIPGSRLYSVLCHYFPDRVEARYRELRKTILTQENTKKHFDAFFAQTHEIAYASDMEKWNDPSDPSLPYRYARQNKNSMISSTREQLHRLDAFFFSFRRYAR